MQVLSALPPRYRDSFSHYEGESPRGLDTELYGEANEKGSWGPRSLWPTPRFRVNSREGLHFIATITEEAYAQKMRDWQRMIAAAIRR
jgi:hypothetical protein